MINEWLLKKGKEEEEDEKNRKNLFPALSVEKSIFQSKISLHRWNDFPEGTQGAAQLVPVSQSGVLQVGMRLLFLNFGFREKMFSC